MEYWMGYLLLGLAAGIFGATLGVGGGIIMVPVLVILFHFPQKSAQGISLAAMVLMAAVAASRYIANPAITVDLRAAGLIGAAAIGGALIGSWLVGYLPVGVLRKLFAAVMVIAAVKLAFTGGEPKTTPDLPPSPAAEQTVDNETGREP